VSNPSVGDERGVRSRWVYAAAALIVIALGLVSRWEAIGLPWFVAKYSGDALWGLVVFIGLAFLFPRRSTRLVTTLAVGFACAVEFSQLFHPSWLDAIRSTLPGGLVLGTPSSTFAWGDITAYLVGITCGVVVELASYRKKTNG
jgi:xanthine/uracil permease